MGSNTWPFGQHEVSAHVQPSPSKRVPIGQHASLLQMHLPAEVEVFALPSVVGPASIVAARVEEPTNVKPVGQQSELVHTQTPSTQA
jgi:hypothetical protein